MRGNGVIARCFCVILRRNCDKGSDKFLIFRREFVSESRKEGIPLKEPLGGRSMVVFGHEWASWKKRPDAFAFLVKSPSIRGLGCSCKGLLQATLCTAW